MTSVESLGCVNSAQSFDSDDESNGGQCNFLLSMSSTITKVIVELMEETFLLFVLPFVCRYFRK